MLLLFGMVIVLTGIACADQVVPAVPETQTLVTVTTADVVGLATENDAVTWSITSGVSLSMRAAIRILAHVTRVGIRGRSGPDSGGVSGYQGFLADLGLLVHALMPEMHLQDFII